MINTIEPLETIMYQNNDWKCMYCDDDREPGSVACTKCYEEVYGDNDTEEASS